MNIKVLLPLFSLAFLPLRGEPSDSSPMVAAPLGSLAKVIDSFLSAYSADNPAWRVEIHIDRNADVGVPPAGFQVGHSEIAGPFYFRPKTSDLLTTEERREVIRDKRFLKFIAEQRRLADEGVTMDPVLNGVGKEKPTGGRSAPVEVGRAEIMTRLLSSRTAAGGTTYFEISAEELVQPGAVVVAVERGSRP